MSTNKITYTLYIDLDGVLCDFLKSVRHHTKINIRSAKEWETVREKAWQVIDKEGKAFWSNLDWHNNGEKLWSVVSKYKPNILSAHPTRPELIGDAINGKQDWVRNNLTNVNEVIIVPGIKKQWYATSDSILVDDYRRNIEQFKEKGGIGIHHVDITTTLKELSYYGIT